MTGTVPRITKRASTKHLQDLKSGNDNSNVAFADTLACEQTYLVQRLGIPANCTLPLKTSSTTSKHLTILSGIMHITLGDDVMVLVEDESLYIPQGVLHGLENRANEKALIIAVEYYG